MVLALVVVGGGAIVDVGSGGSVGSVVDVGVVPATTIVFVVYAAVATTFAVVFGLLSLL